MSSIIYVLKRKMNVSSRREILYSNKTFYPTYETISSSRSCTRNQWKIRFENKARKRRIDLFSGFLTNFLRTSLGKIYRRSSGVVERRHEG